MSKIVVITQSADDSHNQDTIANIITDGAMGLSTNVIKLYVLDDLSIIKDCEPQRKCKSQGRCSVQDDIYRILTDLLDCDMLIISIPLEETHVSRQMNILFNRMTALIDQDGRNVLRKNPKQIVVVSAAEGIDTAKNHSADRVHYIRSLGFDTVAVLYYSDCNGRYKLSDNKAIHDCAIAIGKSLRNNYRSEDDRKAEVGKISVTDSEEFILVNNIE